MSYKILAQFHQDSENSYHRGYYGDDGIPVIIKRPSAEHPTARTLAKLRHEHSILRELRLPGIPVAYSLERHNQDSLALILDDIPGQPLSQILSNQKIGWTLALHVAATLAGILSETHKRRIIHQGIRPAAIFLDRKSALVHLIDFRAASRIDIAAAKSSEAALPEELLAYMSPEQTGRMNRIIDSRSDLYSLGITLYEMLTGQVPFKSADPMEIVHSHIARRPMPPHEVSSAIPRVVSDLVLKLLAKAPEDRYQTARGLKADLDECLRQLGGGNDIQAFPLARSDCDGQLRAAQRLYGREAELETLMAAFDRVRQGSCELLLIAGYSGIGKSVLVNEINKPVAVLGGYFVAGKFDQFNRNIPYDSLVQAFRELVRLILGEKAEKLATWRDRLQAAISPNGALLTDLIPELELIVGPQPSVPTLGPAETQNRFKLLLQDFVRALATAERPLVLFLDDLQWIDPASLKVLEALLTDPNRANLLVLGAYRDNEVDSAHVLALALDVLRRSNVKLHEIRLSPLNLDSVTAMLADMLTQTAQHVSPLAKVVHTKTNGNPFFVSQFVAQLHAEKLLWYDENAGRWVWDLGDLQSQMVTDNVVTFLVSKLQQLPQKTQRLLYLAAAIGHRFELKTLSIIAEQSEVATATDLWPALQAGLLWPLNIDYQAFYPGEYTATEVLASADFRISIKFLHDRVQQAAYALIPDDQRQQIHLRIGRLRLGNRDESALAHDESLFDIAKHLNIGLLLITDQRERALLARLNLIAGRRAKSASAFEAASAYLTAGMSLLPEAAWEQQHELWFSLTSERAECECLNGRFELADTLLNQLLSGVGSDVEYAQVCSLRMRAYGMQGQLVQALAWGYKGLARLGIVIPESPEQLGAAFGEELMAAELNLGDRQIADLVHAPVISDPALAMASTLLNLAATTAYLVSPPAYGVLILKQVNISLKHGTADTSAYGYVSYGLILVSMLGQYAKGREFGQLAISLIDKFRDSSLTCQVHAVFAMYLHLLAPLRKAIESFANAYRAGLEIGDFLWLSYACFSIILFKLNLGDDLQKVSAEASWFLTMANRTKDATAAPQLILCKQVIECLQGRTTDRVSLSDQSFDEVQFRKEIEASRVAPNICRYYLAKLQLYYLYGDYPAALETANKVESLFENLAGLYEKSIFIFYHGLIQFAVSASAVPAERQRYAESLAAYQAKLTGWAAQSPANYAHKAAIFQAEAAALAGNPEAGKLYEQAIEAAAQSGFTREEALANELAATYYLGQGNAGAATEHMQKARRAYLRWGAIAKVAQLDQNYPQLAPRETRSIQPAALPVAESGAADSTPNKVDSTLDLITLLRVAQTLASQIVLDDLLQQILLAVVTNSGAQRGCLALKRNDSLFIEAMINSDGVVRTKLGIPVENSTELATSVIQYVARTQETVVLGDASGRNHFASDRYIATNQPRSLLCLALMHQGQVVGILYLENNLAINVFTESRVELLRLLSSHAAVSLQNALLYSEVKAVTEQLRISNRELSETNAQLQLELAERARAEQERARAELERATLREEIIRVQNVRLAELSTPLIPINDQIMVMPIIGTVDEQRAQQVVEAALTGVQLHRTQTVIMDITGIKHIDTHVARTLLQAASSLRLLGTQAVLTGIRAEVAQTLVRLGIDLGQIVTLSTLQRGIAYALSRTGQAQRGDGGGTKLAMEKRAKRPQAD